MSDLLKEAIADAKAVRETALQNAKMALEEAFTPHLKSMLSAKLAEEDLEEDEDVFEGEHEDEEEEDVDEMGMKPRRDDDDDEDPDEGMHDKPRREDDDDEEEVDESEIVEIDGVKYAPIVSEEEHEDDPRREDDDDEDMDESEELDLEAVIKELEEELNESEPGEEEESVQEGAHEEDDEEEKVDEEIVNEEDEEDLEEQSTSSGIGKGSGVKQPSAGDEEDPGKGKTHEQVETLSNELNEYKEAVVYLKDKLHEVNILNAKLLFTNKLFKEYALSNDQKLKIVETFDRAQTTREIKLVYTTLAESFNGEKNVKKEVVKESYASKKSGGTAPKTKIITEESQVADRFRKLAGIKS